jgi:hypothetical protein
MHQAPRSRSQRCTKNQHCMPLCAPAAADAMLCSTGFSMCHAGAQSDQFGPGAITRWEVDGLPALLEALQVQIIMEV